MRPRSPCAPASSSATRWATSTGRRWSRATRVYVPLTVDRKVMASVMKTHRFEGITLRVRAGRRGRPLSRAARVAAAVRRRGGPVHATHDARRIDATTTRTSAHARTHGCMTSGDEPGGRRTRAVGLARLLQFGDSMFPVGGFSFSERPRIGGPEARRDRRRDAARVRAHGDRAGGDAATASRSSTRTAPRAAGDSTRSSRIDQRVSSRASSSSETRTMTVRMGRKSPSSARRSIGAPLVGEWLRRASRAARRPAAIPLALAVNFAAQGLPAREAFVVHQYGVARRSSARRCG